MGDTIWGHVRRVFDAETLEVRVTRQGASNVYPYDDVEKIRIGSIADPELKGNRSLATVSAKLQDRFVRCAIRGRDRGETLIADVTPL